MLLAVFSVLADAPWGLAGDHKIPINTDAVGVAIKGYDTVAYFTDGRAVKGTAEFETLWQDARWHFANAQHRDMFKAILNVTPRSTAATERRPLQPASSPK